MAAATPPDLYELYSCMADPGREVAKSVVEKASATLSILGSGYISLFVWGKWRANRVGVDPYQRIMAAYSVFDILISFFPFFLGTWMAPVDTGWWMAVGNTATCSVQGFFNIFGFVGSAVNSRSSGVDA